MANNPGTGTEIPATSTTEFMSEMFPVFITLDVSNPGPVGSNGSLLLVAGLAATTGPVLGSTKTADDTIAGRAIDTAAIVSLTASIDGGAAVSELSAIGANGAFTLTPGMLATIAGGTLADGAHTVVVNAADAGGNATSAGVSFTLDTGTPVLNAGLVQITGTTALAQTIGATSNDTVRGTVTDTSGVISLFGTLDGAGSRNLTGDIGGGDSFTITPAELTSLAGGTLPDGKHSLVLQATDSAGNVTTQTVNFTLQTQLGVPTLTLAQSDQTTGATTTGSSLITLIGTTTPGAIATLTNNGAIATAGATGLFQFTNVPVTVGGNLISVQVTDLAGNTNNASLNVEQAGSGGISPVAEWDAITRQAITTDASPPTVSSRALAIESLSVYNAVSAINGTPGFLSSLTAPAGANAQAAAIAAANRALDSLYPAQAAGFDAQAAADLAAIPNSLAKTEGIAVGQAAAAEILALRANDGTADNGITDIGSSVPGQWQMTAPAFAPGLQPQWATAVPFALQRPDQFLPAPPPDISTQAYADAVNQTFLLGELNSATRTPLETQKALFFNDQTGTDTPPGQWNQIAATVAQAQGLGLSQYALLFAELNVAEADAAIAAWNGKYTYNAWRPITLFQDPSASGNAAIQGDPGWQPLIVTPNFPEFPEGHGAFSGAAAAVLANFFGDSTSFTATSQSTPGVTLNYDSFSQAAQDAAMSRIWGGIHFTFSADAALTLGQQIGQWTIGAFNSGADTTPPKVTLDNPGGEITNHDPTITGTVSSGFGVSELNAILKNGQTATVPVNADGSFAYKVSVPLDGSADGANNVTFVAIDPAGNRSPAVTYGFSLVTHAPTITLAGDSVKNGATIGAGAVLDGTIGLESGDSLTSLSYAFDGGAAASIVVDPITLVFDAPLDVTTLSPGSHQLTLTALDVAGNTTTQFMAVTYKLPPLTLTSMTPALGAADVGVTFRPSISFSRAIDKSSLDSSDFFATDSTGAVLPATIVPFADGTGAWLLPTGEFPGASAITLTVKGGGIKAAADGALLDAAGIGSPGSSLSETYTTVSQAPVFGTTISGLVVDPGPDGTPLTQDDVKSSVGNSSVFSSDTWKLPIEHAKVFILGHEADAVFSAADGSFNLANVPVGDVKVAIDGRTATNAPAGYFFPEMVMDISVNAGVNNLIAASMGSPQQQAGMADNPAVYLPRVATSSLKTISSTEATTITAPPEANLGSGSFTLTQQQLASLSLTVQPNSIVDENGNPVANAQVGIAPVPASLVMDMLPAGLMQHSFDITIQAPGGSVFTAPAELTMPNVFGLAPGDKTYILSFDHTTGRLVIDGTATASADGKTVTTDAGSGVMAPGWHGMTPPGTDGKGKVGDEYPATYGAAYLDFLKAEQGANNTSSHINVDGNLVINTTSNVWTIGSGGFSAAGGTLSNAGHFGNGLSAGADAFGLLNNLGTNASDVYNHPTDPWAWGQLGLQFIADGSNLALDVGGYIPGPAGRIASGARAATAGINMYNDFHPPGGTTPPGSAPVLQNQVNNANSSNPFSTLGHNLVSGGAQVQVAAQSVALSGFDAIVAHVQAEADYQKPLWVRIKDDLTTLTALDVFDYTKPDLGVTQAQLAALLPQLPTFQAAIEDYTNAVLGLANHPTIPELARELIDGAAAELAADNAAFFRLIQKPVTLRAVAAGASNFAAGGAQVQSNALAAGTVAVDPSNVIVDNRPSTTMYVALKSLADNSVQRLSFNAGGGYDFFLAPNTYYQVTVYDPSTGAVGEASFKSKASGQDTAIPLVGLVPDPAAPGANGLTPTQSYVIGVSGANESNLVPGISDLAAIQQGLFNGTVLPGTTGLVASLPLLGSAQSVALAGSSSNGLSTFAYVATGTYGLAVVDVSNPFTPIALGQISLGGNATGVAINSALGIAVVAAGAAGLMFVDVSNPNQLAIVGSSPIDTTAVRVIAGTAYANAGTSIDSFDIATGTLLQTMNLGGATLTGVATFGTTIYTMDAGHVLRVIDTASGAMAVQGSVTLPAGGNGLAVGNGVVYVPAASGNNSGGYLTVDVSNPAAPVLIEGVDNAAMAGAAMALNGSGIGLAVQVVQQGPPNPGLHNVADLINTSDPTKTGLLQTRFELPSAPGDVTIGQGIGFVADGASGLQVLNYLAPDLNGVAPNLTITAPPTDVDPLTGGTQVFEGLPVSIGVTVADDVQVRNVALLLNGSVAANALSFPFALTAALPTIATLGSNAVTLQVEAVDTGGNITVSAPIPVQLVPDTRPLLLVGQSVGEGAILSQFNRTISLTFSKPLDPASVTTTDFALTDINGVVEPLSLVLTGNNQVVRLNYPTLAVGHYQLVVDAPLVTDFNGIVLGGKSLTTDFEVQAFSAIFTNAAGGSWNKASNWNINAVPGATDAVFIGNAIGATVSYDGGTDSVAKLVASGSGLFQVTAGALTVTDSLQVNEQLTVGGGALAAVGAVNIGGDGAIFVNNRATTLDNVSIAAGGQLQISNNNWLFGGGNYANDGLISLNSVGNDTRFVVAGDVTLTGNGLIQLSDTAVNFITSNGTAVTLTNAGNTISGGGLIGDSNLSLVNKAGGTINATANNNLIIQGGQPVINAGLMEATGPGALLIRSASLTNTGTIAAPVANSTVQLQSASITGGTLMTANGGVIVEIDRGSVIDSVTLAQDSNLTVANNQYLFMQGTITNKGTVSLASVGNDTRLVSLGTATLTGGGRIQLSDTTANALASNPGTAASLVNLDNVISGAGRIGNQSDALLSVANATKGVINATAANALTVTLGGGTLTNTGLIEATSTTVANGGLVLLGSTIDNTGSNNAGVIQADGSNSHVNLQSATVVGGTLKTSNGGVIQEVDRGSLLDNVTLDTGANLHVVNNQFLSLTDTFTNHGTVFVDSVGNDTRLVASGGVTLAGTGVVRLSDFAANRISGNAGAILTNADNTLQGSGTIGDGVVTINNGVAGTINATGAGVQLVLTGGIPIVNAGLLEATGPAGLRIASTTVNNSGTIQAMVAGSHVDLASATINGGLLATANGGAILAVDRGSVLNNVEISIASASTLVVLNNQFLTLNGSLANQGTVALASVGNDTRLIVAGTVTLNGGGVVQLSDTSANSIRGDGAQAVLINQNNVITGAGMLGDGVDALLTLNNTTNGVINASAANALRIVMPGGTLTNTGLIESTSTVGGNGGLSIQSTTIDNTGNTNAGVILSTGTNSHVDLQSGVILGGTLTTTNGGIFREVDRGGVLDGIVLSTGSGFNVVNDQYLVIRNTITNKGTIAVASVGNDTRLNASGGVTLTGGGVVQMSETSANLIGGAAGAVLTNVDNTIQGSGSIGDGVVSFVNQAGGTVNATGGGVRLLIAGGVAVTNAGLIEATGAAGLGIIGTAINNSGTIAAPVAGSHVDLQSATINGGLLTSANGGSFRVADRGSTLNGLTIDTGTQINVINNDYLALQGTITNKGTIGVNSVGNDTRLNANGTVTLIGGGVVAISGAAANTLGGAAGAVLINVDNTIQGGGSIGDGVVSFVNQAGGTVNANGPSTRMLLTGAVASSNAGLIEDTGAAGLGIIGTTINNSGTIAAPVAGSHVDLQSATINGGLLTSANGGFFQAVDRGSTLVGVTIDTDAQVKVVNNEYLFLQGTVTNHGTIQVNSVGNDTRLVIVPGATLAGGGVVQLSNSTANTISSAGTSTAFTDLDNTIAGGGTFGDGNMTVAIGAAGTVNATGSIALILATGANTVTNAGVLEATGSGGLKITGGGGVANSGTFWANGAGVVVSGPVTGTGSGRITGAATLEFVGAVASGQTITFDAGATGTLRLDASQVFAGTISGLAIDGGNAVDLSDISFIGGTTKATFVGDTSGGTLTVTDNTHTANLALTGDYTGQTWAVLSDGHGGTLAHDPAAPASGASVAVFGGQAPSPFAALFSNVGIGITPGDWLPGSHVAAPPAPSATPPAAAAAPFDASLMPWTLPHLGA